MVLGRNLIFGHLDLEGLCLRAGLRVQVRG